MLNSRATAQCSRVTGWQAATTVGDGRWVVEVRLPAKLVGAAPREGAVWGLGLARNDTSSEEISAWSPARGWWANLRQFGSVRFVRRPGA